MADLTRVGIEWQSVGFEQGERHLDAVAAKSKSAETATQSLERAQRSSGGAIARMVESIERQLGVLVELQRAQQLAGVSAGQLAAAEKAVAIANEQAAVAATKAAIANQNGAAASARAASAAEHLAAEQEAVVKTANRLNAAHGTVVGSSKNLNYAMLNLSRQASDLGLGFAMAASSGDPLKLVFLTLIQQGPQVADIFAQLKTEGLGVGEALKKMYLSAAPILVPLAAIGAVAATSFALFEREVDKNTKHATSWGDTWKAVVKVTGDYIMDGPIGDGLKWLGKAFSKTLDLVTGIVAAGAVKIAGFFGASYLAIVNNWKRLPEVVGVILTNAANAAIKATEWLINKGIDGINALGKNFGFAQIGKVALGTFKSAATDIAKQFDADQKRIEAATEKGMKDYLSKVAAQADKEWEKRQKAKKATEDHTKAIQANNDAYRAADDALTAYLAKLNEEIAMMGMSAEQLRRRQAEQMALAADTPQIADFIRQVAKLYEDQARVGKEAADVQKAVGAAANDNIKTFDQLGIRIPTAMENAAYEMAEAARAARELSYDIEDIAYAINRSDWTSAFAGLVNVLAKVETAFKNATTAKDKYSAVAQLAQGVGSAVGGTGGAVVGGAGSGALAGIGLSSSLATLGVATGPIGWAAMAGIGAVLGGLGGLFGSSKAKKQQKAQEAAQRAAEEAQRQQTIADTGRSLEIALLRAQGNELAAVAKEREDELSKLAALSPALAEQQKAVYAALDLAEAQAKAAEQTQTQIGLMRQLQAMDDAVNGTTVALQATFAALESLSDQARAALGGAR